MFQRPERVPVPSARGVQRMAVLAKKKRERNVIFKLLHEGISSVYSELNEILKAKEILPAEAMGKVLHDVRFPEVRCR